MAEKLTPQQQLAINDRGGKLLVSAAAGSGKTKVLVDRLLSYITQSNGQLNIDDFLIITYTQAAAAELRGKIAAKLNERLQAEPANWHLQRQVQRLYMAKISTVHSFCADILREYAYRLDIPADFRVADEKESRMLQFQVLENLMESVFTEADPDVLTFVDSQELKRDDRSIPPVILKVYDSAKCHINPKAWLETCLNSASVENLTDASQTVWGQYLIDELHSYLDMQIEALTNCVNQAEIDGSIPKPAQLLRDTIFQLQTLRAKTLWDDIVNAKNIEYGTLSFPKKCNNPELVERIKHIRNTCKLKLKTKLLPFADYSDKVLEDLSGCSAAIKGLIKLVDQFSLQYDQLKHFRRILDFGDLEHKMLDLLWGKKRQSITALAQEIGKRFHEIMVDEYQDSNEVQDAIFSALTQRRQNCFMVGDVKQSIYQFRLADPNIFLDKYDHYVPAEKAQPGQGRKVMLSHNFRSAGPVIHAVNDVFAHCMIPKVGGLVYDDAVMLHEGIPHIAIEEPEIELCVLETQNATYSDEAAYTADRIIDLLDGTHMVRDGDTCRAIVADDIVILLRSPKTNGAEFQYALESRGIRVNAASGINILETEEISLLRSILQIIENPLQDIPLIAVLASRIFCFTADDLTLIRTENPRRYFYDSLKQSKAEKACEFIDLLQKLRQESKLCAVSQLINGIFRVTRMDSIYASMDDGSVRKENLQIFYDIAVRCEGAGITEIGQFMDYLDSLGIEGVTKPPEYKISGAVTIMSIHKSKGLEFPVVFLCGLSRDFSRRSIQENVLCHRDLGIGLNCVDLVNRVRYPSVAKKAITARILSDGLSEEMRVLYVAMTRARDRLIMTYAANNPQKDIQALVNSMDMCSKTLMISDAMCPGDWILMVALRRMEAGELFALGGRPDHLQVSDNPWSISAVTISAEDADKENADVISGSQKTACDTDLLKQSLAFRYSNIASTVFPSKQTATQLKGRYKDQEVAENTQHLYSGIGIWKQPAFAQSNAPTSIAFGNAMHAVMQHICFERCGDMNGIQNELMRLSAEQLVDQDMIDSVDPQMIYNFFSTDIGKKVCFSAHVLREFKFSVLDDASKYDSRIREDQILLQGVVDCAILEPDGITVIDFKTDRVTDSNLEQTAQMYYLQVTAYARALSRIYGLPIKAAYLYFFRKNCFVPVSV